MKQKFIQTLLLILLPTLFTACGSDNNNDPADDISGLTVNTDLKNNEVSAKGGSFFLQIKTDGKWTASSKDSWCTINNKEGNGNASTICSVSANDGDERYTVITVTSNGKSENVTITQKEGNGKEPDPDPDPSGYAGRIEIPKLLGGNMNQFITHSTKRNGKDYPTYSIEYSYEYKHCYWVAYRFDNTTGGSVGQNENYQPDPNIPKQYQTYKDDYNFSANGYTRGHLCASSDRQYSVEANKQTFYMSNISPQLQTGFNQSGTTWDKAEGVVQKWGKITQASDTLYVIKGGTIGPNKIKGYIDNGIAIPKYFFMAVLYCSNKNYKAIAFYLPHENLKVPPYSSKELKDYVLSIDELEKETGFDFFINLPDDVEKQVEANYTLSDWSW